VVQGTPKIREKIQAYHDDNTGPHHRYRSWEHCFRYFHGSTPEAVAEHRDHAALQLGFYSASWGMYRGSSFLLQHAYTIHRGVIDVLVEPQFLVLWRQEFGARSGDDSNLVPVILNAASAIREAYRPFAPPVESRQASDTLVTKVLLGTFGCLPACDRYFSDGFKSNGFAYACLNTTFIEQVLHFCTNNLCKLCDEQARIESAGGVRYPLMKLVDMFLWQIGFERSAAAQRG
jgi:hypothetical protein